MNYQREISEAVKARGYSGEGFTQSQFALSQTAKLCEELSEIIHCFRLDSQGSVEMYHGLELASSAASGIFNKPQHMGNPVINVKLASAELADVVIVAMVLADCLQIDILQLALDKSKKDKSRGVRTTVPSGRD